MKVGFVGFGTLADRSKLHARQPMKDVLSGQRQRLIYMAPNSQAKLVDIYIARKVGPMPTYIMLIIRREDALVENLKWGFEPGRARPLQNHPSFLRKSSRDRPRTGTARDFADQRFHQRGQVRVAKPTRPYPWRKQQPSSHLRPRTSQFCIGSSVTAFA